MSKQIEANRFILSPLASEFIGFYQEMLRGLGSYQQLGNRLTKLAEQAHAFRQFDRVKELAQILINLPLKNYQAIGHYYLAVSTNSMGNGDQDTARKLFELVANTAPQTYKAKAMLSLAALSLHARDYESQFRFLLEAERAACDVSTKTRSRLGMVIYKSMEGFHKQSLKDLEDLYSLARLSRPVAFFDYLNSLAVEFGEVGRMDEAENVSRLTIASPFAPYYPEWRETRQEIQQRTRRASFVAISKPKAEETSNQQALEIYEPEDEPDTNLLMFRGRKPLYRQVPHYSCIEAAGDQFTAHQKRTIIVDIVCNLDNADLDRLFAFAIEIDDQPTRSRRPRQIDLESKSTLEDLMCLWANNDLDPNDYVAVLSALRDCKDSLRRQNLINEMISHIYRFTQERLQGEAMWRKRVEAQLTPESD